jgi:hypothetical protein
MIMLTTADSGDGTADSDRGRPTNALVTRSPAFDLANLRIG